MFPFHKIYSYLFKSFNVHSETETITRLKNEGVEKIMIIKRSWIYGLALIWLPIMITIVALGNIWIAFSYSTSIDLIRYTNIIGVSISLVLFIFSFLIYLAYFRKVYQIPHIETNIEKLQEDLRIGDENFIRFFNQTILNQLIVLVLIGANIYFSLAFPLKESLSIIIFECFLLILQWIFLKMHRKRMVDLEMDYNIVSPGKVTFINQSGMLSSSQSVDGEKVKTVTSKYPSWLASVFHYGTIEVLTEGDALRGTTTIFFVPSPVETARLMEILIFRREEDHRQQDILKQENNGILPETPIHHESKGEKNLRELSPDSTVVPRDVIYDVKGVVRDIVPGK